MSDRVRPFSNGEQDTAWVARNCDLCAQGPDCDGATDCPMANALTEACWGDGTISRDMAERIGYPGPGVAYTWDCPARELAVSDYEPRVRDRIATRMTCCEIDSIHDGNVYYGIYHGETCRIVGDLYMNTVAEFMKMAQNTMNTLGAKLWRFVQTHDDGRGEWQDADGNQFDDWYGKTEEASQ